MRVQALEQLIKSGLTLDSDQATFMATETVHQATRAAQSGSQDATNALAQLTRSSIGSGIGGMSSEAQNILLMDVLQQVSGISSVVFMPSISSRTVADTVTSIIARALFSLKPTPRSSSSELLTPGNLRRWMEGHVLGAGFGVIWM
jgi:hypothetical protein